MSMMMRRDAQTTKSWQVRFPANALAIVLGLALVGCPTSDDIELVYDGGNVRVDVLTPGPDVPKVTPDVPVGTDLGGGEEVVEGTCQSVADCQHLTAGDCELISCLSGFCRVATSPDNSPCDDGNPCTITRCTGGICANKGKTDCDDGNPCTSDPCTPEAGCTHIPATVDCDDGDECTTGDKCFDGVCVGGQLTCDIGTIDNPANNCNHIKTLDPAAPSGEYWVATNATGQPTQVYCEMTIAGGGWTRIGWVNGDKPICSYVQGFGAAGDLLQPTVSATTVLPSATVADLPTATTDLLVTVGQQHMIYRSASPNFTWPAIADGTINAVTLVDYNVSASINDGEFVALATTGIVNNGPAMLGGQMPDGKYTVYLGVGGTWSKTFEQDTACSNLIGHNGFYGGTAIGPNAWGAAGGLYIK